ncbi:MAG: hypothetical protein Q7U68_07860 [Candidatus Roizmanbacteria bacterium]|nr:hypothetical protein [Candidatus Roizmanbacteria bacterium]
MKFIQKGVEVWSDAEGIEIQKQGLKARVGEKEGVLEVDTILTALGRISDRRLAEALDHSPHRQPFVLMGDCKRPRTLFEAIHGAAHVSRKIGISS